MLKKIGRYEIREPLGKGAMADVYRAYDPSLGREIALKVLLPQLAQDNEITVRFREEARVAAALRHPNIIEVYDYGEENGRYYMAMTYIASGTLADLIKERGALPLEQVTALLVPIADALHYAHEMNVVHRDIKPGNILIDERSRPMLADFGIAYAVRDTDLTLPGTMFGTAPYMSPEQAVGGQATCSSDIYALGIVLYEALTGRKPFQGALVSVLAQHAHESPPPPRSLNPAISRAVEAVVLQALAKKPEARFATAGEMARALQAAASGKAMPRGTLLESRLFLVTTLVLCLLGLVLVGNAIAGRGASSSGAPRDEAPVARVQPTEKATQVRRAASPTRSIIETPPRSRGSASPTPRQSATPEPTETGILLVVDTSLNDSAATRTPTPSPTDVPTSSPSPLPPTATSGERTSTATAAGPSATPAPTFSPVPASAPLPPGVFVGFEGEIGWRRGNQAYAELTRSTEQVHTGTSGKVAYNFPAVSDNFVVFMAQPTRSLAGRPTGLVAWVYGDGSGHFLNAWIQDSAGEVRAYTFGRIYHQGWRQIVAWFDDSTGWPNVNISGTDNGVLDYPLRFYGFVVDGAPDGQASSGTIYLDDFSTTSEPLARPVATATTALLPTDPPPAATAPPATTAPAAPSQPPIAATATVPAPVATVPPSPEPPTPTSPPPVSPTRDPAAGYGQFRTEVEFRHESVNSLLAGRVVDRSGSGIAGAVIEIESPRTTTVSGPEGWYRFDNILLTGGVPVNVTLKGRGLSAYAPNVEIRQGMTTFLYWIEVTAPGN
jgi:serine/threonine-protein kinase